MNTDERMQAMWAVMERETSEPGRIMIHKIMNGGHHDEYTANAEIKNMIPVYWLGVTPRPADMVALLGALGITPMLAGSLVREAYDLAKGKASGLGFEAPHLDANEWDCYWCIAMMIADYWYTHSGNIETAAMLAYQYLSDPDKR